MSLRVQYDVLTEPVSTSPESVTVDRWQGSETVPMRLAILPVACLALTFSGPLSTSPESVRVDKFAFQHPVAPPAKVLPVAEHPAFAGPISPSFAENVSVDRWAGNEPAAIPPARRIVLEGGAVEPLAGALAQSPITESGWHGSRPDIIWPANRTIAEGWFSEPNAAALAQSPITLDNWQGYQPAGLPSANRIVGEGWFAEPNAAAMAQSPVTVASWFHQQPEPPRLPFAFAPLLAEPQQPGIVSAAPVAPPVSGWAFQDPIAPPATKPIPLGWFCDPINTVFAETVTLDRWEGHWPQPQPQRQRAEVGWQTVALQPPVPFDWYRETHTPQFPAVQPIRTDKTFIELVPFVPPLPAFGWYTPASTPLIRSPLPGGFFGATSFVPLVSSAPALRGYIVLQRTDGAYIVLKQA